MALASTLVEGKARSGGGSHRRLCSGENSRVGGWRLNSVRFNV